MALPDPERTRRHVGCALWLTGVLGGGLLLVLLFLLPPLFGSHPGAKYLAMFIGAFLAFPAAVIYLTVPRLLDRYDPEPWYALLGCLVWGAFAACGFAAFINSLFGGAVAIFAGGQVGDTFATVMSAPFVEELLKGLGVFGVFYFLRREFDGVVDGIIYATFTAIGFAAVENVVYYSRAALAPSGVQLVWTFAMRGVLAPWGHPLYTSMTGIGLGIARETDRASVRWLAPILGYIGAVALHATWNASAVIAQGLGGGGLWLLALSLPLWLIFVAAFFVIVIVLVRRRGRIIREHLLDEVALGHLSTTELDLICSAFGLVRARMRWGDRGIEFVRAAARLALSKWHSERASRAHMHTVSMDFILPLRERLAQLRTGLR